MIWSIVFVHEFKSYSVRTWSHKTESIIKDRSEDRTPLICDVSPQEKRR